MPAGIGSPSGEPEKFELRLWPTGDKNRYVEFRNPEFVEYREFSSSLPVKIISYTDEKPTSLKEVQAQTSKRFYLHVKQLKKDNSFWNRKNLGLIGSSVILSNAVMAGVNYISSILTGEPINPSVYESAVIASVAAPLIYIGMWVVDKREVKKRINNININMEKFRNVPTDKIEVEQDEELKDIFNAIENNKPLEVPKPKDEETYQSIEKVLSEWHGLTRRAEEVYSQKVAAHHGFLAKV
jgi:hypothetical protein